MKKPTTTPERSRIMRAVRRRDTPPELAVRKALHAMGLRFRLHRADLPGTPDVVLPRWRVALFVHGCFWHRHPGCPKATMPKSNRTYWKSKFTANVARDARVSHELEEMGWKVVVIWECETRDPERLAITLRERLPLPPR